MSDFIDEVAQRSGLSPLFARRAIERACHRAGMGPEELGPKSLRGALPEIERAISVFVGDKLPQAMAAISELCID